MLFYYNLVNTFFFVEKSNPGGQILGNNSDSEYYNAGTSTNNDLTGNEEEEQMESEPSTSSSSLLAKSTSILNLPTSGKRMKMATEQSKISSFLDKMSKKDQDRADEAFARAIYAAGLPLSIFSENPLWNVALNILRPVYKPPTTHSLRKPLLEAEYNRVMNLAKEKIQNAQCLTVILDGWTNIRGDGVVNFLLATPSIVFHKAIVPGENRETGQYIGQELLKVIFEVGSANVYLIVTDNASNMQAAWNIVKSKFPHIFTAGCVVHGLSLLAKDVMRIPQLSAARNKAKKAVKLNKKRVTLAVFRKKQKENYGNQATSLKMPNPTRFAGDALLFSSLKKNKAALQATVISENVNIDPLVRNDILDDRFWQDVTIAENLLKPIARGITFLEGDAPNLSLVPRVFMDIKQQIMNTLHNSSLSSSVCNTILERLAKRIDFTCKDIHKAAYFVDPRFRGEGLADEECLNSLEIIKQISTHLNLDINEVVANAAMYKSQSGFFSRPILWELAASNDCNPVVWWQGLCLNQPLQPVASRLLQLIPSSAGSERNWSSFEHIHSKKRNRLTNERVEKLVAIRSNLYLSDENLGVKNKNMSTQDCLYYRQIKATSLDIEYDHDDQLIYQYINNENQDTDTDTDNESIEDESENEELANDTEDISD